MKSYGSIRALTLGLACLAASSVPAFGESIVYPETFNWPGGDSQSRALRNLGWCGGIAGDLFCDNPRSGSVNQRDEGDVSRRNYAGDDSFAYWSQARIAADRLMYADGLSLDPSNLVSVMWNQSDISNDPLHLAFKIGNDRNISGQSFTSGLTFSSRTQSGNVLPGGGFESAALGLPSGTSEALGVGWDGKDTGISQSDNFTLIAVPLPPAAWLYGSAILGVGMLGRRKRKS